jgi:hypothetical protein
MEAHWRPTRVPHEGLSGASCQVQFRTGALRSPSMPAGHRCPHLCSTPALGSANHSVTHAMYFIFHGLLLTVICHAPPPCCATCRSSQSSHLPLHLCSQGNTSPVSCTQSCARTCPSLSPCESMVESHFRQTAQATIWSCLALGIMEMSLARTVAGLL